MPRKQAAIRSQPERGESSRPASHDPRFISPEAEDMYLTYISHRVALPERGFTPSQAEFPEFTDFPARYGLTEWLRHPTGYHLELVREFYANAAASGGHTVTVRGQRIRLSSGRIRRYIGASTPAEDQYRDLIRHPIPWVHVVNRVTGSQLPVPTTGPPPEEPTGNLAYSALLPAARVWCQLVTSRFLPISHFSDLHPERVYLIYAIMEDLSIHFGRLIRDAIFSAARNHHLGLPFPCMITDFILSEGVELPSALNTIIRGPLSDTSIRRILGTVNPRRRVPRRVAVPLQTAGGPIPAAASSSAPLPSDYVQHCLYVQRCLQLIGQQQYYLAEAQGVDTSGWTAFPPPPPMSQPQPPPSSPQPTDHDYASAEDGAEE